MTTEMAQTTKKSLKEVQEYLWLKYIDDAETEGELDDQAALEFLQDHYAKNPLESNKEFFFYGILLFEMAFSNEEKKLPYFIRAKRILEKYRSISGEMDWEEINDRIDDINSFLAEEGVLRQVETAGDILLDPNLDLQSFLAERARFPEIPEGMVLVPGGAFRSGPDKVEDTLEPFLIDSHPVTNAQFGLFLEQTGYRKPKYWDDPRFNQPSQPVVGISLGDAKKYASWASKDLPTEKQWEKAARGVDGRTYPWGEEVRGKGLHFDLDPEKEASREIGRFPAEASPYGCLEMAGYVWEWTKSPWEKGSKLRALKGGSWADDERFIRCASRLYANEREKADNVGFRCCINPT